MPTPQEVKGDLGKWTEHEDMIIKRVCGMSGLPPETPDLKLIYGWRQFYSVDQLKQICLENGYTCFTDFFSIAAMWKLDYQVTPELIC